MRIAELVPDASSTLRRRIYSKIGRTGRNRCWSWTGATVLTRDGVRRPKIRAGGGGSRVLLVARVLLAMRDRVPLSEREAVRLEAGHTCHNFWCVNPRHLEWQTRIENEAAKLEHGRYCTFLAAVDELAALEAGC